MAENICDRISEVVTMLGMEQQAAQPETRITGLVVTYNEALRLRECLESLAFCDQLLVIDLGSTDESPSIADQCGAEVVRHEWVPVVEHVWPDAMPLARHGWILRADPDEVFPAPMIDDLLEMIVDDSLGMVSLPHQNYFLRRQLSTTRWGGIRHVPKVFHRDRVLLRPFVHRGIECRVGFQHRVMSRTDECAIQHYWADSWRQLFAKHRRYIKQEGGSRYHRGERFEWRRLPRVTWEALVQDLRGYHGLRGGPSGVSLSFFYAWYVAMSLLSLRQYQRSVNWKRLDRKPGLDSVEGGWEEPFSGSR